MSRPAWFSAVLMTGFVSLLVLSGFGEAVTSAAPPQDVESALLEETETGFIDCPLQDCLAFLSDLHRIPIVIDRGALADAGIQVDAPVNLELKSVHLASALNILLTPLGLDWIIAHDVLQITTRKKADAVLTTQAYPIEDLAKAGITERALQDLVAKLVAPQSWKETGGAGAVRGIPGRLIVLQSRRNHEHVAGLLRKLRRHAAAERERAAELTSAERAEATILNEINSQTETGFIDTPLSDAIAYLADLHQIRIWLDRAALTEAGVAVDTPVTLELSSIKLSSAFELILSPLKLDWVIEDEVLKITTQAAAAKSLQIRTYDVTALVTAELTGRELLETLTSTIDPDSWSIHKGGAAGHVPDYGFEPTPDATRNILVVLQDRRNHDRIAELLTQLAKQDP